MIMDDKTQEEYAVEVEEVPAEAASTGTPVTGQSDADRLKTLMTLEERIKRQVTQIDQITVDKKKHAEMMEDIFLNDTTYQQHLEAAKKANQVKSLTKSQISKRPDVAQLSEKIKDFKIQLKELQVMLSNELAEYQQLAGVNEIEGDDGQVREIVPNFKLVKKSSRKQ